MFENFSDLTVGQRNALDALAGRDVHVTRQQASESLGISVEFEYTNPTRKESFTYGV